MKYYKKLQKLIGRRGTITQIEDMISDRADGIATELSRFEKDLKGNDKGYQFCLGMDKDAYLDFDIYLIKTRAKDNKKRVYYISEINSSC